MTGPTDYPDSWKPGRAAQPAPSVAPAEAVAMAVDSFIAALSQQEFDALVARTRGA